MIVQSLTRVVTQGVRGQVQIVSKRNNYPYYHRVSVSPPRVRISFAEKMFWGTFIAFTMLSVPAWVIVHHREYMGEEMPTREE